jgi:hypothetical protein
LLRYCAVNFRLFGIFGVAGLGGVASLVVKHVRLRS